MTDVEKLKGIIEEIDVLIEHNVKDSTPEFKTWHHEAKRFVYHHFGSDSPEYENFLKLFIPCVRTLNSDKLDIAHLKRELTAAKGVFQNYLSELCDDSAEADVAFEPEQGIERIFSRFKNIAIQLTKRHKQKETLIITDEYDVQDLLHSLLKLYFDDVRDEEPIPSFGGASSRTDFYIPEIKTFIEVKKTRSSLRDKELRDQLIIDIAQYQKHQGCEKIYCFVYDPDNILNNPGGIKNDFEEKYKGLVRVFIES